MYRYTVSSLCCVFVFAAVLCAALAACGTDNSPSSKDCIALTGDGRFYPGTFSGSIVNGTPTGYGIFTGTIPDEGGSGEFTGTLPDNGGIVTIKCDTWEDGYAQGYAKFEFERGDTYEGQVKDTLFDGEGTISYGFKEDGVYISIGKYTGSFKRGMREGHGVRTYNVIFRDLIDSTWAAMSTSSIWDNGSWKYEGEFVDNSPTENGIFTYNSSGSIYYKGDYYKDLPNGYGVMYFEDRSSIKRLEGWFEEAVPKDYVNIYYSDGNDYYGEIEVEGFKPNGQGVMNMSDGARYEGVFELGIYSEGTLTWPNGDWYEGAFPGSGMLCINGYTRRGIAEKVETGWHFQQSD